MKPFPLTRKKTFCRLCGGWRLWQNCRHLSRMNTEWTKMLWEELETYFAGQSLPRCSRLHLTQDFSLHWNRSIFSISSQSCSHLRYPFVFSHFSSLFLIFFPFVPFYAAILLHPNSAIRQNTFYPGCQWPDLTWQLSALEHLLPPPLCVLALIPYRSDRDKIKLQRPYMVTPKVTVLLLLLGGFYQNKVMKKDLRMTDALVMPVD